MYVYHYYYDLEVYFKGAEKWLSDNSTCCVSLRMSSDPSTHVTPAPSGTETGFLGIAGFQPSQESPSLSSKRDPASGEWVGGEQQRRALIHLILGSDKFRLKMQ